MKLYGALLSPFVRKVAVVLAEKDIAFTFGRGGPGQLNDEFLAASPFGKIPAIEDDGFTLADSTVIALYLEARVADPALLPADPQARARALWLDEYADSILGGAALKILFNRLVGPKLLKIGGDEAAALQGEADLPKTLEYLESVAPTEGWLVGDAFTLADISVASIIRSLVYVGKRLDVDAGPRTAAWYGRVTARPAWLQIAEIENKTIGRLLPPA